MDVHSVRRCRARLSKYWSGVSEEEVKNKGSWGCGGLAETCQREDWIAGTLFVIKETT
jgi:hypothetical protein